MFATVGLVVLRVLGVVLRLFCALLDITKAAARLCVPAFFCVTLLREAPVYFKEIREISAVRGD